MSIGKRIEEMLKEESGLNESLKFNFTADFTQPTEGFEVERITSTSKNIIGQCLDILEENGHPQSGIAMIPSYSGTKWVFLDSDTQEKIGLLKLKTFWYKAGGTITV